MRDSNSLDAWSVWAQLTRLGDGFSHLGEDVATAFESKINTFLEDGERNAGKLKVKLVTGDTFAGSTEFEVHVTVEILGTNNVENDNVLGHVAIGILLGHKTGRDTRNRADHRDTGVKKSHRSCTNGGH